MKPVSSSRASSGDFDHRFKGPQPVDLFLAEVLQHMAADQRFLTGMADAHAPGDNLVPGVMMMERNPFLSGIAAARLHFDLAAARSISSWITTSADSSDLKKRMSPRPRRAPLLFM